MRNLFITTILNALGITLIKNGLFVQEYMCLYLLSNILDATSIHNDDFDRKLKKLTNANNIYVFMNGDLYIHKWDNERNRYALLTSIDLYDDNYITVIG